MQRFVEQIKNSTGTVEYLHRNQAGSTRFLTGSTGAVADKCTYGAYGAPTCEGTATTPLGFDGAYTSSDTGLIYGSPWVIVGEVMRVLGRVGV